jgi:uncharacterized protein (DUF2342 family)
VAWSKLCEDTHLVNACAMEAHTTRLPSSTDAQSWEPAPKSILDITKLPEGLVRKEWLNSVKKEFKTLVDSGTFVFDEMKDGDTSTPTMEIFKVNMKSNGSLDKLKMRLVMHGDIQNGQLLEDK